VSITLWTFLSESGRDTLQEWSDGARLPTRVRALMDQKLDVLRCQPFEAVIHSKLLAGPIAQHIYKLRLNGIVAVRIMLCRGPLLGDVGYTMLVGAVERDGKLVPRDAPERAGRNRAIVLERPKERRKVHDRFYRASH
jgi:hypothetical protein